MRWWFCTPEDPVMAELDVWYWNGIQGHSARTEKTSPSILEPRGTGGAVQGASLLQRALQLVQTHLDDAWWFH